MKKQFDQNGTKFTIEVNFKESTTERKLDGITTHFIRVKSEDGKYDKTIDFRTTPNEVQFASRFEEYVSKAELSARDWANMPAKSEAERVLYALGFS